MNTETTTNDSKRKRGLLILAVLVIVGILAWTAHWFIYGRHFESTDDAYVSSDIVQITSEIPGTVIALHVDDTQSVQKGQALVELDSADAESAMASAEADLARAVRQVRGLFAQNGQFNAQIAERQAALKRAQNDYNRRVSLAADGAVSGEELAHAQDAITEISASLAAAREQLNATHAQTEGTTIANHPQVLRAASAVRDAELALHRTKLIAPIAGVVAKRSVQLGQRIAAGTPLFAVVAQEDAWVDANFKEVQLEKMRIGQPVELHADLYGTDVVYHGKIAGFAAGSGAAFALLPAQNASGNWIKIVQRIPVRIALDPKELHDHPLRVGLSMSVKVDVADTSGLLVATQVRTTPRPVGISDADNSDAQARIDRIIKANAG
ncbi:HlyD family secretion protein [Stenotrophobium rhamnosiphilum]|uniref:EmrA/EmrK family multidrug efflux transporter periplasmic adaptor subunit n=1 Tax=Stenotrophobium rhamnosiphilum TaxID=2029166 RepID=A0A2T5MK92_9GAMM|nr:HlyD family efflux transporter periplasmic adaptor subunit [Stenotrophobium rhamnosiphilum]PTU33003.1 EmrA/EmrK family multidrug efflux transporter periplasmic adaptor subunit [Stenotrophobium rhamnosiphilum]